MADDFKIADFLVAEGVESWRVISDGACAFYPTASFQASARLVEAIGGIDGIGAHPPNVDVRHDAAATLSGDPWSTEPTQWKVRRVPD